MYLVPGGVPGPRVYLVLGASNVPGLGGVPGQNGGSNWSGGAPGRVISHT